MLFFFYTFILPCLSRISLEDLYSFIILYAISWMFKLSDPARVYFFVYIFLPSFLFEVYIYLLAVNIFIQDALQGFLFEINIRFCPFDFRKKPTKWWTICGNSDTAPVTCWGRSSMFITGTGYGGVGALSSPTVLLCQISIMITLLQF